LPRTSAKSHPSARKKAKPGSRPFRLGDDIADPKERAAFLAALAKSEREFRRGETYSVEQVLDMLREIRAV